MDRVLLNRYVIDAATSTEKPDPKPVLATIALEKVPEGETAEDKIRFCDERLALLVEMQTEVNTVQKVAREKGIGAGLLNIVGHASIQSPEDNGASVIQQLNLLMNDSDGAGASSNKESRQQLASTDAVAETVSATEQAAANDTDSVELEQLTTMQKIITTINEHRAAMLVDVLVCFFASCFAISLVS